MRTTLTLDDDVTESLREEMRRTGSSLKQTVNDCLRRGFDAPRPEDLVQEYRVQARDLGLRQGIRLDDVAGLMDALDGPVAP
jgi:hypothetical protein